MITSFLSSDLSYAIAMTLLHSIWQIGLIALLLSLVLRFVPESSSINRYYISIAALGVSMVTVLVTFGTYFLEASSSQIISVGVLNSVVSENNPAAILPFSLDFFNKYSIVIVNAWIIGSLLFLLRFTGAYFYIRHIVNKAELNNSKLINVLKRLKKKYDIHRNIIIHESYRITTPLVMGYIKPVILFPVGLANQLSIEEIEAILAHELAHIKRHDFLFNLLQSFAEVMFYYHPGIWYISSRISFERENCCDDMAIDMTGNSISYARTLVKLQDLKHKSYNPALSFSGNKSQFSQRILRILNLPANSTNMKQKLIAFLLVFTSVFAFAKNTSDNSSPVEKSSNLDVYIIEDCPQETEEIAIFLDTIPEKKTFHITKKTNDEELELEMENGEITKLKINGDEIPEEKYEEYDDIIIELKPNEDHDIITVFPDCDKNTGQFFFKDKTFGRTIKIDSLVKRLQEKNELFGELDEHIYQFDLNDFEYEMEEFRNEWKDKHGDQFNSFQIIRELYDDDENIVIEIDSVLDLFPKHLEWYSPKHFNKNKIIIGGDHDDIILEYLGEDDHVSILKEKIEKENPLFNYPHPGHDDNIFFFESKKNSGSVSEALTDHLIKDDLIQTNEKNKLELTGKFMKINGEKQPTNIWKKYKKIYEDKTGIELSRKSRIQVEIDPQSKKEMYFRKMI
ncbi:MAG: M56 family metallopeptidase [Saprospiraceae bacterium]|nr:M56 family metallopeptidase [Saprospiraceae bacterium]